MTFQTRCGDWNVRFDGASSSDADGLVVRWEWTFGDEGALGGNVVHAFPGPGSYTAQLLVHDDSGSQDTRSETVTLVECKAGELEAAASLQPLRLALPDLTVSVDEEGVSCAIATGGSPPYDFEARIRTADGVASIPAGSSFGGSSGCFTWRPGPADVGRHCIEVTVRDLVSSLTGCMHVVVVLQPFTPPGKEDGAGTPDPAPGPAVAARPASTRPVPVVHAWAQPGPWLVLALLGCLLVLFVAMARRRREG